MKIAPFATRLALVGPLLVLSSPAWGQQAPGSDSPLRSSFQETSRQASEPRNDDFSRYSPQGGLDQAEVPDRRRYSGTSGEVSTRNGNEPRGTQAQTQARDTRQRAEGAESRVRPTGEPLQPLSPENAAQAPETTASLQDLYAPEGIGLGGFDLFPSVSLRGGFQEVSGQGDAYYSLSGAVEGRGQIADVAVDFSASGAVDNTGGDFGEVTFNSALNGSYELNSHVRFNAGATYGLTPQNGQFTDSTNSLSNLPDEQVIGGSASVTLTGNRLSITPRVQIEDHHFSGSSAASNFDYLETEVGARLAYELSSRLSLFSDIAYTERAFDRELGSDSLRRGSTTETFAAGVTYAPGDWLSVELSAGLEEAEFADGSSLQSATGNAAINWQATALTQFTLSGEYGVEDDVITAGGVRRGQVSLSGVHRFRNYMQLASSLGYLTEDGPNQASESRLNAETEFSYAVRRGVFLNLGGNLSYSLSGANEGNTDWQVYTGIRLAR